MKEDSILSIIYTFFVGLLLAVFVGFGINTFYTAPPAPEFPSVLNIVGKEPSSEQIAAQNKFDSQNRAYQAAMKPYNRNVSIMALGAAIILLAISLIFEHRIRFIADGVMLGGLFTLVYSLIRGFASGNSRYIFVVISIGLVVVLVLGYRRFVAGHTHFSARPLH